MKCSLSLAIIFLIEIICYNVKSIAGYVFEEAKLDEVNHVTENVVQVLDMIKLIKEKYGNREPLKTQEMLFIKFDISVSV